MINWCLQVRATSDWLEGGGGGGGALLSPLLTPQTRHINRIHLIGQFPSAIFTYKTQTAFVSISPLC